MVLNLSRMGRPVLLEVISLPVIRTLIQQGQLRMETFKVATSQVNCRPIRMMTLLLTPRRKDTCTRPTRGHLGNLLVKAIWRLQKVICEENFLIICMFSSLIKLSFYTQVWGLFILSQITTIDV